MHGPFEIELKIRATNGENSAVATYRMPVGVCPTQDQIRTALANTEEKLKTELGPEWRLQTRNEFENEVISERYGGITPRFATKETWDDAPS